MNEIIENGTLERMPVTIEVKPEATIVAPAQRLLHGALEMIVDSDAMYDIGAQEVAQAKAMRKALDDERKELTRPLDELKAKLMDKYRPAIACCDQVIEAIQPKMLAYRKEQEEKQRIERERAEAAARAERERLQREADEVRRRAEEEAAIARKKVEAEAAEARRKAEEESARLAAAGREAEAEEAKRKAERDAQEARERAERDAQEARERAEREARDLQETAAITVAAPVVTVLPKSSGTSVSKTWKARVVDKEAFVRFVAANPMYLELLAVNETGLNAQARSLRANLKFPGIEAFEEETVVSRAKRA